MQRQLGIGAVVTCTALSAWADEITHYGEANPGSPVSPYG